MYRVLKTISLFVSYLLAHLRWPLSGTAVPAVVMYHACSGSEWKYDVDPTNLKKQLTYLRTQRTVVALSDIIMHARGEKKADQRAVAITVDDGYLDTYKIFFPLMKELQIPFTLFLTTDLSEQEKLGNLPRPTWDQIKEMHDSGLVTIAVHGHTHTNWPDALTVGKLESEITASADAIKTAVGSVPGVVAAPAGRITPEVVDYIHSRGFTALCLATTGLIESPTDVFRLPRIPVDRDTTNILLRLSMTRALTIHQAYTHALRRLLPL